MRGLILAMTGVAACCATASHAGAVHAPVTRCGLNFVDSNNSMSRRDPKQVLASLRAMANRTAANTVTIVVMTFQEDANSTDIRYNYTCCTKSDEEILAVAAQAQEKGVEVIIKPQILFKCNRLDDPATCRGWGNGNWRGKIGLSPPFSADQWGAWFASYTAMVTHYAAVASKIPNLNGFVIGTELPSTATKDAEWAAVSGAVRATFADSGWHNPKTVASSPPLLFAAASDAFTQRNWSSFDEIGVDAYFPLDSLKNESSEVPTIASLVANWQPIKAQMYNTSKFWGRPLGFTELGYSSTTYCATRPAQPVTSNVSDQCQTNAYTAVYEVFSSEPWWWGVQWWSWGASNGDALPGDLSLAIRGKPAETVIKNACIAMSQNQAQDKP